MESGDGSTSMVHYECHVCDMTATCVKTTTASLAWQSHMDKHARKRGYSMWTWKVLPLPLD